MIVLTLGTFDLFHAGHVHLLEECRHKAGRYGAVVVAVNPDEFVKSYKGKAPVIDLRDRIEVLKACRHVDRVLPNIGGADSKVVIELIAPDVIAVGSDWQYRDYLGQLQVTEEWLRERNIRVWFIPRVGDRSSSAIKAKILERT